MKIYCFIRGDLYTKNAKSTLSYAAAILYKNNYVHCAVIMKKISSLFNKNRN